MLGVVDHFLAVSLEISDGFGDELEVFFLGDAEGAVDMEIPGLAEDGDRRGCGFDEMADVGVAVDGVAGEARGTEGGEAGVLEAEVSRAGEELLVLGVGAGPAALNVIDTEFVELLGDDEFVGDGEGDGFTLRAVPERGVEYGDFHGWPH